MKQTLVVLSMFTLLCGCGGNKAMRIGDFQKKEETGKAKELVLFSHAHKIDNLNRLGRKAKKSFGWGSKDPQLPPSYGGVKNIAIVSFTGELSSSRIITRREEGDYIITESSHLDFSKDFKKEFLFEAYKVFHVALGRQKHDFTLASPRTILPQAAYKALPYADAPDKKSALYTFFFGAETFDGDPAMPGNGPYEGVSAPGFKYMLPPIDERGTGSHSEMEAENPTSLNPLKMFNKVLHPYTTNKKEMDAFKAAMGKLARDLGMDAVLTVELKIGENSAGQNRQVDITHVIVNMINKNAEFVWSGRVETRFTEEAVAREGMTAQELWQGVSETYKFLIERTISKMVRDHGGTPMFAWEAEGYVAGNDSSAGTPTKPIEWVTINGGKFTMGSDSGEKVSEDAKPIHEVAIKTFEMSKTAVTVEQYAECVIKGGCTEPATVGNYCNWGVAGRRLHPVNCVDWDQAQAYASFKGARLPSEAEFEYAATSGGREQKYPWGDETPDCELAVFSSGGEPDGCGRNSTWPVCSKPKGNTAQGLCDMAGNVCQWVQDKYKDSYRGAPADGRAFEGRGSRRVLRGGSFSNDVAGYLRADYRGFEDPGRRDGVGIGFRLVKSSR